MDRTSNYYIGAEDGPQYLTGSRFYPLRFNASTIIERPEPEQQAPAQINPWL